MEDGALHGTRAPVCWSPSTPLGGEATMFFQQKFQTLEMLALVTL